MKYKILEHPSDIGIEIKGENIETVLAQGAFALYSIIFEKIPVRSSEFKNIEIRSNGQTIDDFIVDYFNRLIYFIDAENMLLEKINYIDEKDFIIRSIFFKYKLKDVKIKKIVKAATYNKFLFEKCDSEFKLRIIFDV